MWARLASCGVLLATTAGCASDSAREDDAGPVGIEAQNDDETFPPDDDEGDDNGASEGDDETSPPDDDEGDDNATSDPPSWIETVIEEGEELGRLVSDSGAQQASDAVLGFEDVTRTDWVRFEGVWAQGIDRDNDGSFDTIAVDRTGDGIATEWYVDLNLDGDFDVHFIDRHGDLSEVYISYGGGWSNVDVVAYDSTGDGQWDYFLPLLSGSARDVRDAARDDAEAEVADMIINQWTISEHGAALIELDRAVSSALAGTESWDDY